MVDLLLCIVETFLVDRIWVGVLLTFVVITGWIVRGKFLKSIYHVFDFWMFRGIFSFGVSAFAFLPDGGFYPEPPGEVFLEALVVKTL